MQVINTLSLQTIKMKVAFAIILFFCSFFLIGQEKNEIKVKASLKVENNEGLINVIGIAENLDVLFQSELEYLLLALKTSSSNNLVKNSQEGVFTLSPNENKLLSSLKINMQENELLKLYLYIRKEKMLISKDTLFISTRSRLQTNKESEESFEIKGLVVEDVITKLGKDFYDYFYQKYSSSSLKYPFVIKINERPKIGINSEIIIIVEDSEVYKMTTNPNQEYLEASAQQAIRAINGFAKRRELLKQTNRQF